MSSGGINSNNMRMIIRRAYAKDKRVADDDALLIAIVWEMYGWDKDLSLMMNLRRMPSPETITRTRRRLITDGLIAPSKEATERRYNNFKKTRKGLGYGV
jgi:hypothetical protein